MLEYYLEPILNHGPYQTSPNFQIKTLQRQDDMEDKQRQHHQMKLNATVIERYFEYFSVLKLEKKPRAVGSVSSGLPMDHPPP